MEGFTTLCCSCKNALLFWSHLSYNKPVRSFLICDIDMKLCSKCQALIDTGSMGCVTVSYLLHERLPLFGKCISFLDWGHFSVQPLAISEYVDCCSMQRYHWHVQVMDSLHQLALEGSRRPYLQESLILVAVLCPPMVAHALSGIIVDSPKEDDIHLMVTRFLLEHTHTHTHTHTHRSTQNDWKYV